ADGAGGLGAGVVAPAGAVPARIREAVDAEAIELGIVVDRILTVVGPGVELPIADQAVTDPASWPAGPFIGPLMTLPDWRRVPSATTSEVADPDGDDPDGDDPDGGDAEAGDGGTS